MKTREWRTQNGVLIIVREGIYEFLGAIQCIDIDRDMITVGNTEECEGFSEVSLSHCR